MPYEVLGVGELHVKRRAELVAVFVLFSLSLRVSSCAQLVSFQW